MLRYEKHREFSSGNLNSHIGKELIITEKRGDWKGSAVGPALFDKLIKSGLNWRDVS